MAAPTRRSRRIAAASASREGSRAPSSEPEAAERDNTLLRQHMTLALAQTSPEPSPAPVAVIAPVPAPSPSPPRVEQLPNLTPPAQNNLLRRAFGFLASPFGISALRLGRAVEPTSTPSTPIPTSAPLGELPSTRKRPAPEAEPEDEPEAENKHVQEPQPAIKLLTATPTRSKTPRGPSTMNRNRPTSLKAISERTEHSSAHTRAPEPTPSRARTIASVRSKALLQRQLNTPTRTLAWNRPSMPREPNADTRLAKLNYYHETKEHLKNLEKDKEIQEMVKHRTKRVKVDDLVYIPHNRPGDPSGTFRVYDEDSEDEMEVDETVELRKNIFEEVTTPEKKQEQVVQERKALAPEKEQEKEKEKEQVVKAVAKDGMFPSVGKRDDQYQEGTAQEARLGCIFKMALSHFTATGELLPVF